MGETVTVGCKLPAGVILHLHTGGERDPKTGFLIGIRVDESKGRVRLKGSNSRTVVGGFGMTSNVPKDFWEAWKDQNKDRPLFKNQIVFAVSDSASFGAVANELKNDASTGLEPINPEDLPKGLHSENFQGMTDAQRKAAENFINEV